MNFKFIRHAGAPGREKVTVDQMKIIFTDLQAVLLCMSLGAGCGESGPPAFTSGRTLLRVGEGPVEVPAETLNQGRGLFNRNCASCHGYEGRGDGNAARNLAVKPRDFTAAEFLYGSAGAGQLPRDGDLKSTIRNGVTARGMPAWGGMRDADIDAVVSYIKTFSARWQAPAAGPAASP